MKERPILFSAPMVRAILEGRKTVTRRIVKPAPYLQEIAGGYGGQLLCFPDRKKKGRGLIWPNAKEAILEQCHYGQPGDRLWVREAWRASHDLNSTPPREITKDSLVVYEATMPSYSEIGIVGKLRPSMFMPRWASRITLEVTSVRVERLRAISEGQAAAEGVHRVSVGSGYQDRFSAEPMTWADAVETNAGHEDARLAFRDLWESINGAGSWNANPWVWAVEFKRVEAQVA